MLMTPANGHPHCVCQGSQAPIGAGGIHPQSLRRPLVVSCQLTQKPINVALSVFQKTGSELSRVHVSQLLKGIVLLCRKEMPST